MEFLSLLVAFACVVFGGIIFCASLPEDEGRGLGSVGGLSLALSGYFFHQFVKATVNNYDTYDFLLCAFIICGLISAICLYIKFKKP